MASEAFELPNGKTLHRFTDADGSPWACIAYDHGAFCRRCRRVDEFVEALLQNVLDGRMEVFDDPERGMVFRVTDEGRRQVDHMLGGEGDESNG
jgi:hypothetical protein